MNDARIDWAKWIGVVLLVGGTWTGIVINFMEWKEAIAIERMGSLQLGREVASIRDELKGLEAALDKLKERKDDLPVRLEERMVAMQRQLDRIERAQNRRR